MPSTTHPQLGFAYRDDRNRCVTGIRIKGAPCDHSDSIDWSANADGGRYDMRNLSRRNARFAGMRYSGTMSLLALAAFMVTAATTQGQTVGNGASLSVVGESNRAITRLPELVDGRLSEFQQQLEAQQQQIARQRARIDELEQAVCGGSISDQLLAEPSVASPSNSWTPELGRGCLPCNDSASSPRFDLGGQYRVMFNAANFDFHSTTIDDAQPSQSFFNQRFRTWLTITTSENVQGYVQAEIGHILWGDDREFPKAFSGPRFPPAGDDRVGMELRRGYLTYRSDAGGRWRVGIQDWQDSFGQTLASSDWDFNVGGLSWEGTAPALGNARVLAGTFVLWEGDVQDADDSLLFTLDLDWSGMPKSGFGLSLYFVPDHDQHLYPIAAPYDAAFDFWLGARAHSICGAAPLNGFILYNPGWRYELGGVEAFEHHGFALKAEIGPSPLFGGRVSTQLLYSTDEFRTLAQSVRDNFGAQGYWSYLAITGPHGPSDVNDLGVSLQNRELGLFTVQAKYDYDLTERLVGTFAAGLLRSASTNPTSQAHDMGTEVMKMFTYDFGGGLKMDLGAAVYFTGDFYKPSLAVPSPDTLWEAFSRVQLEF